MKKITILVADNDPAIIQQLTSKIADDNQLELIGLADNGRDAYNIIVNNHPEVVICDLLLPQFDGLSLVEKVRGDEYNNEDTKFIICTPFTNNMMISEMSRCGVDYVLAKPYDMTMITDKIKRIYQFTNSVKYRGVLDKNIDQSISESLINIGIPVNLTGYRYIASAVKAVYNDETLLDGVTKILYPQIAKQHNSTPQRVEKAMRHAIEVAWDKDGAHNSKNSFNFTLKKGKKRPTNSEFIAVVSKKLRATA